jgi:hypothetical protein
MEVVSVESVCPSEKKKLLCHNLRCLQKFSKVYN